MSDPDPIGVALQAAGALERLSIPYALVGSLASSLTGEPRATYDVDIAADVREKHALPLFLELHERFHVDLQDMHRAVREKDMFQFVHSKEYVKVDLYVRRAIGFQASEFERAIRRLVRKDPPGWLSVASAEDTVLQKLRWYRLGGEMSNQQWRDVLGVVKARGELLDTSYLWKWAPVIGVGDLLSKVLEDSGRP